MPNRKLAQVWEEPGLSKREVQGAASTMVELRLRAEAVDSARMCAAIASPCYRRARRYNRRAARTDT